MFRRRYPRFRRRGAATVEMAISMLVIIPVFLYALFLDDLLRYRLNQQEAITTSTWDFTVQNYDGSLKTYSPAKDPGGATLVQQHARMMFCDHESGSEHYSAIDNPNAADNDCTGTEHHVGAVVAHECWLNKNAHQITCAAPDPKVAQSSDGLWQDVQKGQHPNGGMFSCSGNLIVENYLLPRTFLQEFAGNENLSKAKWDNAATDAHKNSKAGDDTTAYYFDKDEFAVVADSWAYTTPQSIDPGTKSGSPGATQMWNDVNTVFTQNLAYTPYKVVAELFTADLSRQDLIDPAWGGPIFAKGDNPTTPNVSIQPVKAPSKSISQDTGSQSYFNSPWQDWSSNPYQQTYQKRGDNYMGCKSAQSC